MWPHFFCYTLYIKLIKYLYEYCARNCIFLCVKHDRKRNKRLFSAMALFDHVNLVYGTVSEFCTMSGCPDMTGPGQR